MSLIDKIDRSRLPEHVAIIMDGNGRWAKAQGQPRSYGHQEGVVSVHKIMDAVTQLGLNYLTLYTFSTENWNRPEEEVQALMSLMVTAIHRETPNLMEKNVRLTAIGDLSRLRPDAYATLQECINTTAGNTGTTLVLALSYSSRWEITEAVRQIAREVSEGQLRAEEITEAMVTDHLTTKGIPDPFVESLTHNSIIIQLPLLHGQVNNRLEKVLSVFDQSRKDANSRQIMQIDESLYADDADMLYILHRLTSAAADAKLRQDMNVEDEYFSAIEKRDTEIMLRDKRIEAQTIELARQECLLEAQHNQLTEQQNQLTEQQSQLTEQQNQLTEQQNQLTEQQNQLLKERQKLHSLVSALVSNGMSEEQISAMTGYSIDEINSCLGED